MNQKGKEKTVRNRTGLFKIVHFKCVKKCLIKGNGYGKEEIFLALLNMLGAQITSCDTAENTIT